MKTDELWARFQEYAIFAPQLKFTLDVSRVTIPAGYFDQMRERMNRAFVAMEGLEAGQIANPDEKRMVGHYWLRDSKRAPTAEIRQQIDGAVRSIHQFVAQVHSGKIVSSTGKRFQSMIIVGIGGSGLGPQLVTQALGSADDKVAVYFFDNTDPDGMQNVLSRIPDLGSALCVIISKSGGTKETRNGQLVAKQAFQAAGLRFAAHAIAITGEGSELDRTAVSEKWLARFPMWDWVGGRTSELSAVGLLPAALQGYDIDEMLRGAREMDELTRVRDPRRNPAAMMALMWYQVGGGRGAKDMVVLPYKDRLELFSRYLQQLVMESLGKERDLAGQVVNQGIAVYGNKGSTDQHAYVQQLRDGVNNFFAIFIEVLQDQARHTVQGKAEPHTLEVEPGVTCGDYLSGFYLGTRRALYENKRESITITIDEVSAYALGQLIALFERSVGLYASLINVNAYHQPGVEAGKKAAAEVIALQHKVVAYLQRSSAGGTAEQIAVAIGAPEATETVFHILRHLAANQRVRFGEAESATRTIYQPLARV